MKKYSLYIGGILILALVSSTQAAVPPPGPPINGIKTNARLFNDFSTTTLTIVNGNSVNLGAPSSVTIDESLFTDDGVGGNFANRHDLTLSGDAGVTNQVFNIDASYTVSALVTLAAGSNAPRKEGGLRINSPVTGDALFLVNTDAGEIVAFGGGAPFFSFSSGAQPDYVPGTQILMGYTMIGAGDGAGPGQNTMEYFIDRDGPGAAFGLETSGPLPWTNLEGGPLNYNVALYNQIAPNLANSSEFLAGDFNDIRYAAIPEPASAILGLMGIVGLAASRRRSARI